MELLCPAWMGRHGRGWSRSDGDGQTPPRWVATMSGSERVVEVLQSCKVGTLVLFNAHEQ